MAVPLDETTTIFRTHCERNYYTTLLQWAETGIGNKNRHNYDVKTITIEKLAMCHGRLMPAISSTWTAHQWLFLLQSVQRMRRKTSRWLLTLESSGYSKFCIRLSGKMETKSKVPYQSTKQHCHHRRESQSYSPYTCQTSPLADGATMQCCRRTNQCQKNLKIPHENTHQIACVIWVKAIKVDRSCPDSPSQ